MIIINRWYARLGNNIKQISNVIDLAIVYKHNVKFELSHDFFDLSIIEQFFSKYNNSKIITGAFFSKKKLSYTPKWNLELNEVFGLHEKEKKELLKKAFKLKNIKKLPENDLVIHIRSGDIFSSTPHPYYVPPPLAYYTKQIDKKNYDNILIICEDKKNPVVNKLLELYKNATYTKNSLQKDIELILGASNIVFSVGTFIPSLMLISDNIKYLYGKELNNEELEDYYKVMKPWKNTEKQRDYILTYKY